MKDYYRGSICALLSAVGFGTVPILAIYSYQRNVNVCSLLFLRFSIASLFLFSYVFLKYKNIKISKKQFLYLFIQGGIFYSLFSLCYFSAVKNIPAYLAVLIFYTYPVIVTILSYYYYGEKLTLQKLMAMMLSFLGLILVLGNFIDINISGVLWASGAAIFYSIYMIFGDYILKNVTLLITTTFVCLSAAISFFAGGIISGNLRFDFDIQAWYIIIILTIVSACGFLSFFEGIKLTTPVIVSILSMIEPIVTIVLSVILFTDRLGPVQIIGTVLVLVGSARVLFANKT